MKLNKFDQDGLKNFTLYEVKKSIVPEAGEKLTQEANYEKIGLSFTESFVFDDIPDWGTYHGPFQTGRNDKGFFESPSLSKVTAGMIEYWQKRSQETNNVILKTRYLGLVWDFQEKITSTKPNYKIGLEYIETIIKFISEKYADDDYDYVIKAERALDVAIKLNQKDLINVLVEIIIKLEEDEVSEYGFALRTLLESKVVTDTEITERILSNLEVKFESELDKAIHDNYPWNIDRISTILATYYRATGDITKAKSTIKKSGSAIIEICKGENGMQASMYLEHLNKMYNDFQLNDEIPDLLVLLRKKQKEIELTTVTTEESVSAIELASFIDPLFNDDISSTIAKVSYRFVPDKTRLEKGLELIKSDPIQMIFSTKNIDSEGRTLSNVTDEDKEGELMNQLCHTFQRSSFFLYKTIERLIDENILVSEEFNLLIESSPIIDNDRIDIIKCGVQHLEKGNFIIAMSLIIPQLEDAIRNLVEEGGGAVLKRTRNGSYQLKTFDQVLRDSNTVEVLGENICFYLRSILTDQRGLNLRNDLCHGNLTFNSFNPDTAGRILHCLLLVLLVRNKKQN